MFAVSQKPNILTLKYIENSFVFFQHSDFFFKVNYNNIVFSEYYKEIDLMYLRMIYEFI